jgi:hypothetical protein
LGASIVCLSLLNDMSIELFMIRSFI